MNGNDDLIANGRRVVCLFSFKVKERSIFDVSFIQHKGKKIAKRARVRERVCLCLVAYFSIWKMTSIRCSLLRIIRVCHT